PRGHLLRVRPRAAPPRQRTPRRGRGRPRSRPGDDGAGGEVGARGASDRGCPVWIGRTIKSPPPPKEGRNAVSGGVRLRGRNFTLATGHPRAEKVDSGPGDPRGGERAEALELERADAAVARRA